jgi:hypothetical protein
MSACGDAVAGDGIYTFQLSTASFETAPPYLGLLHPGDQPAFSILLGGERYQDLAGAAAVQGLAVSARAPGDPSWTALTVQVQPAGAKDTFVVVP